MQTAMSKVAQGTIPVSARRLATAMAYVNGRGGRAWSDPSHRLASVYARLKLKAQTRLRFAGNNDRLARRQRNRARMSQALQVLAQQHEALSARRQVVTDAFSNRYEHFSARGRLVTDALEEQRERLSARSQAMRSAIESSTDALEEQRERLSARGRAMRSAIESSTDALEEQREKLSARGRAMRSAIESRLAERIGASSFADLSGVRGVEERHRDIYTIPNAITMTRIACSPAISWLILDSQFEAAALGVCLAGASDWVDGFIAKNFNQMSTLGTFIDPLADKILVGCVAVPLVMQGALPTWVVGIMVGRDVLLISGVLWVRSFSRPAGSPFIDWSTKSVDFEVTPTTSSKLNMVSSVALLGASLSNLAWGVPGAEVVEALCYITAATGVVSSAEYARAGLEVRAKFNK